MYACKLLENKTFHARLINLISFQCMSETILLSMQTPEMFHLSHPALNCHKTLFWVYGKTKCAYSAYYFTEVPSFFSPFTLRLAWCCLGSAEVKRQLWAL